VTSWNESYVFVSQLPDEVGIVSRITDESAFEEGDVENGRIEIDELEDEDLESEVVLELGLSSMHF